MQVVVLETHLGRLGIAICEDLLWRSPVVEAAEDAGGKKRISDQNVDWYSTDADIEQGWTPC